MNIHPDDKLKNGMTIYHVIIHPDEANPGMLDSEQWQACVAATPVEAILAVCRAYDDMKPFFAYVRETGYKGAEVVLRYKLTWQKL